MIDTKRPALTLDDTLLGLTYYFFTSLFVLLGLLFGREFVNPPLHREPVQEDFLSYFMHADGLHYQRICTEGYSYNPYARSEVAFFPAYPMTARTVMMATGCRSEVALIATANGALALAFVLLAAYVRQRFPDSPPELVHMTLLAFGLFPTTFFFRMAYSEGLFLAFTLAAMLAIECEANSWVIALLVGLTTATRPLGIALVLVFGMHLWQRSRQWSEFTILCSKWLPLAVSGLAIFMTYQWQLFGDPFAFVKTQYFWRRLPDVSILEKLKSLAILEPIWGPFTRSSAFFCHQLDYHSNPIFSMSIANPLFFLFTATAVLYGTWKRWLSYSECVLAFALLGIPYATKGYDYCLASGGRFAAAAVPMYVVLGRRLTFVPPRLTIAILSLNAAFLGFLAALFAAGFPIF
jgi:hypothetical protein